MDNVFFYITVNIVTESYTILLGYAGLMTKISKNNKRFKVFDPEKTNTKQSSITKLDSGDF